MHGLGKRNGRAPHRGGKMTQRTANKVLLFIAIYLIVFSIAQYVGFLITGTEQTQLIESTYTVIGLECGGLLLKRIVEKAFGRKEEE